MAKKLKIKSPSLYNRISNLEDLKNKISETINHFIRTLRVFLEGYVLLVNHQAFGHPLSIQKSFDFSLNILINGVKNMEGK